jgi:hypothetical protein
VTQLTPRQERLQLVIRQILLDLANSAQLTPSVAAVRDDQLLLTAYRMGELEFREHMLNADAAALAVVMDQFMDLR